MMNSLNHKIIKKHEHLLERCDQVSLAFLLYDDCREGLSALDEDYPISNWCKNEFSRWKEKLIEGIYLIQNFKFLNCLGYKTEDIMYFMNPRSLGTIHLNPKRRSLFLFCESLTINETEELIECMCDNETLFSTANLSSSNLEFYLMLWERHGLDINLQTLKNKMRQNISDVNQDYEKPTLPISGINKLISNDDHYEIINPDKVGVLIIVNQEKFQKSEFKLRRGSQQDCKVLEATMKKKKFDTYTLINLKSYDIFPAIERKVNETFIKNVHSILMVVIMSHGDKDSVYGIDGIAVPTDTVRTALKKCSCINDKPKIILFQACRGTSIPVKELNVIEDDGPQKLLSSITDYFIGFSTLPGCKAFREIEKGSRFIQTLCSFIDNSENETFEKIFKKVIKFFKHNKQFNIQNSHTINMSPEMCIGLTKELYLSPII